MFRLFQQIDIFPRVNDPQILVMVAHNCFRTCDLLCLHIHLRDKADDKIPMLDIFQQVLLNDRLMMPLLQILIIFFSFPRAS